MKILIVSSESFPGHEGRNLQLAQELIRRGHDVIHTGPADPMVNHGFGTTTYNPSFAETPDAVKANTDLFYSWEDLADLVDRSQVILFGQDKHYRAIADYAAKEGKVILWHRDVGADHLFSHHAARMGVRGPAEVKLTAMRKVPADIIRVTGCVQFDGAAPQNQKLDRGSFCEKYGFDPEKKIVVLLATAPKARNTILDESYRKICTAVLDNSDFELIIKSHPRELSGIKKKSDAGTRAEMLLDKGVSGIPECLPEDKYDCLRHSELLIPQHSAIQREAALLHKPMLEVDCIERRAHTMGITAEDIKRIFPSKRFSPPGRKPWLLFGSLNQFIYDMSEGPVKEGALAEIEEFDVFLQNAYNEFIGTDCSSDELPEILSSRSYVFDNKEVYDDYIAKYCLANDGLAYSRVADMVEEVEKDPVLADKLTGLKGGAFIKSFIKRKTRPMRRKLKKFQNR